MNFSCSREGLDEELRQPVSSCDGMNARMISDEPSSPSDLPGLTWDNSNADAWTAPPTGNENILIKNGKAPVEHVIRVSVFDPNSVLEILQLHKEETSIQDVHVMTLGSPGDLLSDADEFNVEISVKGDISKVRRAVEGILGFNIELKICDRMIYF